MEELLELSTNELPQGYGIFPYIIIRQYSAVYVQVPIRFVPRDHYSQIPGSISIAFEGMASIDLSEYLQNEEFLELLKRITKNCSKQCGLPACLAVSKDKAFYFEGDDFKESNEIPAGGLLRSQDQKLLAFNKPHCYAV